MGCGGVFRNGASFAGFGRFWRWLSFAVSLFKVLVCVYYELSEIVKVVVTGVKFYRLREFGRDFAFGSSSTFANFRPQRSKPRILPLEFTI